MPTVPAHTPGPDREGGFSMKEAALGTVLLAVTFLALAGAFTSNMHSIGRAKAYNAAAVFMDETMSSLEGQSYDAILAMNGNTFFNHEEPSQARFRIELTAEPSAVDLLTVRGILYDQIREEEVLRTVTYRSRR